MPSPEADELERMLVRCHRDELIPLSRLCGVNEYGLGLGDLARQTSLMLRRKTSHGAGNIVLRKGEGQRYSEILASLGKEVGLSWEGDPEADAEIERREAALLRFWFVRRWQEQKVEARQLLWERMGLAGPAPSEGQEAALVAEKAFGRGLTYRIAELGPPIRRTMGWLAIVFGLSPLGMCLRPFLVVWALWWLPKPDMQKSLELVVEVARLRQVVRRRVTIGVVGSPSSGKDAGIKAIFGIDSGNISPIAGSTREVTIQRLPRSTALFIVNTPGMGDVIESVTEAARQVLNHIDVYLYVVNAEGGVQAREKADYDRCVATGKPVLAIVNKIDVLRPRDKERYLGDARGKLGASEEDFVAVAFDPLPQLSPGPINLEAVRGWLERRLVGLGKDPEECFGGGAGTP